MRKVLLNKLKSQSLVTIIVGNPWLIMLHSDWFRFTIIQPIKSVWQKERELLQINMIRGDRWVEITRCWLSTMNAIFNLLNPSQ